MLKTAHGRIETPNMAFVATHGSIKLLNKTDHKLANPDLMISNTFHLWVNKKVPEIKKAGGIHKWNGWNKPMMTDSGGFQVFSLGWGKVHGIGKIRSTKHEIRNKFNPPNGGQNSKNKTQITNEGVIFEYDGKKYKLTPEKSIKIQHNIGADIIFVFDECTSPYHNHRYNLEALKRTDRWAVECLDFHKRKKSDQMLFGIVQGGIYKDLRKKSSKFIGSLDFDGFGIGGSFGEKQMKDVVGWALSGLPKEKPRHLLGIGKISDIFTAVEQGIDLFDCVIPTREARHGVIYTKAGRINIKSRDLKARRLAIIHNIRFYKELFAKIREAIHKKKNLNSLKKDYIIK